MALFKKENKKIEQEKLFEKEVTGAKDIVAPPAIEINQNYVRIEEKFSKTYFVFSYPRYLTMGWLAPIINMDAPFDLSFFFHPRQG